MSLVQDPSTSTAANVKAANTAPVATDAALVVTVSPNSSAQTISGPVTANQGTAAALAAAWPVKVTDGTNVLGTPTNPVKVDPTGTTAQPVSGTVAVSSLPTIPTGGNVIGKVEVTDGTNVIGTPTNPVKTDPTGTTAQPVTGTVAVSSLPTIPTGGNVIGKVEVTDGTVVIGTPANPVRCDPTGTTTQPVASALNVMSDYSPVGDGTAVVGTTQGQVDPSGNTIIRGQVLTDEGTFYDHFPNTPGGGTTIYWPLTGTLTFTNGSTTVMGVGTSFLAAVQSYQYVRLAADGEAAYAQVASVQSDTQLTLYTPYAGSSAAGAAVVSNWATVTAAGGSITVSSSYCNIVNGLAAGAKTYLYRSVDYAPLRAVLYSQLSGITAGQVAYAGFVDNPASPLQQVVTQTNTSTGAFTMISGGSAGDITSQVVPLPAGFNPTVLNTFILQQTRLATTLQIGQPNVLQPNVVASVEKDVPNPNTVMTLICGITNGPSAVGSSTTFAIDGVFTGSDDRLEIANTYRGEAIPVRSILGPVYGLAAQPLAITLASNANASAYSSVAQQNTTGATDAILSFSIKTGASGVSATGYINVFGYASDGTTYPEGITGTTSTSLTLTSPPNLVLIAQINANANAAVKTLTGVSFCQQMGMGRLPPYWGIVVQNETGAAFDTTAANSSCSFQLQNDQMF